MKALVTGGTGFVGKHLIKRLLNDRHTLFALVRDVKKGEELKEEPGVHIIQGDLTDATACEKAVQGMDMVYHCAALTGFWGISRDEFYKTNVLGTKNIMDACLKIGCHNVVHVSTTFVYGPRKDDRLLSETDAVGERLFDYERSKLESEKIVLSYAQKGLNVKTVRLTSVYGAEGRLIPTLVEGLLHNKLKIIGTGNNKKHITHILDCVEGIILAGKKGKPGTIYNIGAKDIPTMGEIIKRVSQELGVTTPKGIPIFVASGVAYLMETSSLFTKKPPHLTRSLVDYLSLNHCYDTRLAKEELGFIPRFGFEEGIPSAVREYMKSRNKQ